jgi:hypothetical protein
MILGCCHYSVTSVAMHSVAQRRRLMHLDPQSRNLPPPQVSQTSTSNSELYSYCNPNDWLDTQPSIS